MGVKLGEGTRQRFSSIVSKLKTQLIRGCCVNLSFDFATLGVRLIYTNLEIKEITTGSPGDHVERRYIFLRRKP